MLRILPNILNSLKNSISISQTKDILLRSIMKNNSSESDQSDKLQFNELDGDLFSAPANYSLGHCVGGDFIMGAGIAVKFKQMYNQVDNLVKQNVCTGGVAVLKVNNNRYIYYLVTKDYSYEKPTYVTLEASLNGMRKHMISNNVKYLAMPRIGCGIDGLEWEKVKDSILKTFRNLPIKIVIYNYK